MRRPISPARMRYGADGGITKEEYCWPTSRCRSDKIWKAKGEGLLKNERILFMTGDSESGVFGNVCAKKYKNNEDLGLYMNLCLAATLQGKLWVEGWMNKVIVGTCCSATDPLGMIQLTLGLPGC